jgi:hypothetical protein
MAWGRLCQGMKVERFMYMCIRLVIVAKRRDLSFELDCEVRAFRVDIAGVVTLIGVIS